MNNNDAVAHSLRAFWYNRKMLYAVVLFAFVMGGTYGLYKRIAKPQYRADTTVTTLPSYSEIVYTTSYRNEFSQQSPALVLTQTHTEVLLSRTIARRVVQKLLDDGDLSLEFGRSNTLLRPLALLTNAGLHLVNYGKYHVPDPLEALTSRMKASVEIDDVPRSFILNISVTWSNPVVAQKAANHFARIYVENTQAENQRAFSLTRDSISRKIETKYEELRALEAQIRDVKSASPVYVSLQTETPLQVRQVEAYSEERSRLELKSLELRARMESSRRVGRVADTVALREEYEATRQALMSVSDLIRSREKELEKMPDLEYNLFFLEERKEEIRQSLGTLQESLMQTGLAEMRNIQAVRVIDPAILPVYPTGPGWLTRGFVAGLAGLVLAIGLLVVGEPIAGKVRAFSDVHSEFIGFAGLMPRIGKPANGRQRWFGDRGVAGRQVLGKHAAYILEHLTNGGGTTVMLDSMNGPIRHAGAVKELLRYAPTKSLVINLDADLDRVLMSDFNRASPGEGSKEHPTPIYGGRIEYVQWIQSGPRVQVDRSRVESVLSYLSERKSEYRNVFVIPPGSRRFPYASLLASSVDKIVLLLEANRDREQDVTYYEKRYAAEAGRVYAVITDVSYPPDYMFV